MAIIGSGLEVHVSEWDVEVEVTPTGVNLRVVSAGILGASAERKSVTNLNRKEPANPTGAAVGLQVIDAQEPSVGGSMMASVRIVRGSTDTEVSGMVSYAPGDSSRGDIELTCLIRASAIVDEMVYRDRHGGSIPKSLWLDVEPAGIGGSTSAQQWSVRGVGLSKMALPRQ